MAIYLVTKLENGKRNTFVCETNNLSATNSIPGEYLQISYQNVDSLINMNTELPVYMTIYFDRFGTKKTSYICGNSFDSVFDILRRNYDASNFQVITKTNYSWYEIR